MRRFLATLLIVLSLFVVPAMAYDWTDDGSASWTDDDSYAWVSDNTAVADASSPRFPTFPSFPALPSY